MDNQQNQIVITLLDDQSKTAGVYLGILGKRTLRDNWEFFIGVTHKLGKIIHGVYIQ